MKSTLQKGYTLVELVVAIAIMSLAIAAIGLTLSMVYRESIVNKNWSLAVGQADQAGRWISRDVQSAAEVTAWSPSTWQCSMKRYSWNGSGMDNITISYVIDIDNNLRRQVNGVQPGMVVAQFIDGTGTNTNFTKLVSDNTTTYILNVRSVYGNVPYSKQYRIYQRALK